MDERDQYSLTSVDMISLNLTLIANDNAKLITDAFLGKILYPAEKIRFQNALLLDDRYRLYTNSPPLTP